MQRTPFKKLFKGLTGLAGLGIILSSPLVLIGYFAFAEHERRSNVLNTGYVVPAIVTESKWLGRSCVFNYRFTFNNTTYIGGEGGCRLVDGHPVGSSLKVRFDPSDPANSVAHDADLWPGWAIAPVLIALPLLFLGGVATYAIVRDAFRAPRRRKTVRR